MLLYLNKKRNQIMETFLQGAICQVFVKVPVKDTVTQPHIKYGSGPLEERRGSGFLIDAAEAGLPTLSSPYLVVTNFHVVARAASIAVRFQSTTEERPLSMTAVSVNPQYDLAILRLASVGDDFPESCHALAFGKTKDVQSNTEIYAVGYPLGLPEIQIQQGRRTGFHVSAEDILLQHSAALNHGNSGGPLVVVDDDPNVRVRVVGVNVAIAAKAQAIDFAIMVERLQWMVDVYRKTGKLLQPRFALRFQYQPGDSSISEHLLQFHDEDNVPGVLISSICNDENNPFRRFDWITEVDGIPLNARGKVTVPWLNKIAPLIPFSIYVSRLPYGQEVEFSVLRHHLPDSPELRIYGAKPYEKRTIVWHLVHDAHPPIREIHLPFEQPDVEIIGGMVLTDITTNAIREFKLKNRRSPGVIVVNLLDQGSVKHKQAYRNLAQPGTVLTEVNDVAFYSLAELRELLRNHWHPAEEVIIFETELHHLLVLPLAELHEDNECVASVHGRSNYSHCLPLSNLSATVQVASEDSNGNSDSSEDDELVQYEKELYESLGIYKRRVAY